MYEAHSDIPDFRFRGPAVLGSDSKGTTKFSSVKYYASIYLEPDFLDFLINRGVIQCGGKRELYRRVWVRVGRPSNPSWTFRLLKEGKQGIPIDKLARLCLEAEVPLSAADEYVLRVRARSHFAQEIFDGKVDRGYGLRGV